MGAHLGGGVPLAHSDAALHRPLQRIPVHSDGKGDAQLIRPGVPLADSCACRNPSSALARRTIWLFVLHTWACRMLWKVETDVGRATPVVSTVLARPARRSLVDILRATSSKSFDCTSGNTAAFKGATAGWNLHRAAAEPHTPGRPPATGRLVLGPMQPILSSATGCACAASKSSCMCCQAGRQGVAHRQTCSTDWTHKVPRSGGQGAT